jgi:arginine deiminase
MTLEERVEMHEQWLSSMESHHAQLAEDLGRSNERLTRLEENLVNHQATIAMQMGMLMTALARMATEFEERHREMQQGLKDLRELVERYIRYRGNGNTPAN